MEDARNELNKLVNDIMSTEGALENVAHLLSAIKQKTHQEKYFSKCGNIQEVDKHMISCSECLNYMPPLETFWQMSHEVRDMQCETPTHSKDRYQAN